MLAYAERLADLFLRIGVLHFASHHGKKLGKVDRTIACSSRVNMDNGFK